MSDSVAWRGMSDGLLRSEVVRIDVFAYLAIVSVPSEPLDFIS